MTPVADDDIEQRRTDLGRLLKRLRGERKLSQQQLARLTAGEVSDGHIGQIEAGNRGASAKKIAALADAMNLDRDELRELAGAAGVTLTASVEVGGVEIPIWDALRDSHEVGDRVAVLIQPDGTVTLWEVDPEAEGVAALRRVIGERRLSADDWRDIRRQVDEMLGPGE